MESPHLCTGKRIFVPVNLQESSRITWKSKEIKENTFIFSLSSGTQVAIICLLSSWVIYRKYSQGDISETYLLKYWIWLYRRQTPYQEYLWNTKIWSLFTKLSFRRQMVEMYARLYCCCGTMVTWCDGKGNNAASVFLVECFSFIQHSCQLKVLWKIISSALCSHSSHKRKGKRRYSLL